MEKQIQTFNASWPANYLGIAESITFSDLNRKQGKDLYSLCAHLNIDVRDVEAVMGGSIPLWQAISHVLYKNKGYFGDQSMVTPKFFMMLNALCDIYDRSLVQTDLFKKTVVVDSIMTLAKVDEEEANEIYETFTKIQVDEKLHNFILNDIEPRIEEFYGELSFVQIFSLFINQFK